VKDLTSKLPRSSGSPEPQPRTCDPGRPWLPQKTAAPGCTPLGADAGAAQHGAAGPQARQPGRGGAPAHSLCGPGRPPAAARAARRALLPPPLPAALPARMRGPSCGRPQRALPEPGAGRLQHCRPAPCCPPPPAPAWPRPSCPAGSFRRCPRRLARLRPAQAAPVPCQTPSARHAPVLACAAMQGLLGPAGAECSAAANTPMAGHALQCKWTP